MTESTQGKGIPSYIDTNARPSASLGMTGSSKFAIEEMGNFIASASRMATSFRRWFHEAAAVERQVTKTLVFNTSKPELLRVWYDEDKDGVQILFKEGRFPSGVTLMTDVTYTEERWRRLRFIGFWTKPSDFENIIQEAMKSKTLGYAQPA